VIWGRDVACECGLALEEDKVSVSRTCYLHNTLEMRIGSKVPVGFISVKINCSLQVRGCGEVFVWAATARCGGGVAAVVRSWVSNTGSRVRASRAEIAKEEADAADDEKY